MARSYIYNLLIMLFVTWTNTQVVCDSVVWSSEWVSVVRRRTFEGSCDWSFDNQLSGRQSTDKNNSLDSDDYFRSSCRNVSHFPRQLDYTITGSNHLLCCTCVLINFYLPEACSTSQGRKLGSKSVSEQLRTYPSPKPTWTLTRDKLTVAGLEGGAARLLWY